MYRVIYWLRRIRCLFVGHNVCADFQSWDWNSTDWCDKCYADWPQELTTLPVLLNRVYGWFVERKWDWFNRLDDWLYAKCKGRLRPWPGWREY